MVAYHSEHNVGKTFCIGRMYKYFVEERGVKHLLLLGPSNNDVENTLIHGESGIMSAYADSDPNKPTYSARYGKIIHPNGAVTRTASSESPERVRGPNVEIILGDEMGSWAGDALDFYNQAVYGLRLGVSQGIFVTTPRATELMIDLVKCSREKDSNIRIITGSSLENSANLSEQMINNAKRTMNTRRGRQEIMGELILTNEKAAFTPEIFEKAQVELVGEFHPRNWIKFAIGVDPSGDSTSKASDQTGIIVGVLTNTDKVVIVKDATGHLTGQQSVEMIAKLYYEYEKICPGKIRVERNGVGAFFKPMLKKDYPFLPIEDFASSTKKFARAISTAHKYETEIVFHDSGADLVELENEGITWEGVGRSPNRLDALSFAVEGLINNNGYIKRKQFIL